MTIAPWTIAAGAAGLCCAVLDLLAGGAGDLGEWTATLPLITGRYATAGAVVAIVASVLDVVARSLIRGKPRRARLMLLVVAAGGAIALAARPDQLRHPATWTAVAFIGLTAAGVVWAIGTLFPRRPKRGAAILGAVLFGGSALSLLVDPSGLRGTYRSVDAALFGAALGAMAASMRMLARGWGAVLVTIAAAAGVGVPYVFELDHSRDALLVATNGRVDAVGRALNELGLWPSAVPDTRFTRTDARALLTPPTPPDRTRAQWQRRHTDVHDLNLVLVTIDALRADATGLVPGSKSHTPRLDELARNGAAFTRAWSQAPATAGSMESFLTGRYPSHTAVASALRTGQVTAEAPALASIAKGEGFRTAWFTGLATSTLNPLIWTRLQRGFDEVHPTDGAPDAVAQVERGIAWIKEHHRDGRFFLWMHLFDPHEPYVPRDGKAGNDARSRYESEVRYADRALGILLDTLRSERLGERTIIAVHADHGEAFNEHGRYYHGTSFFQTQIHVPLVIHGPTIPGAVIDRPVGNVDLAPTLVDLLGLPPQPKHQGRSLVPTLLDPTLEWPRFALAETLVVDPSVPWSQDRIRAITDGKLKLIEYIDGGARLLFDLETDPGETLNLASDLIDDVRRLRGWLAALDDAWSGTSKARSATRSTMETLRARLTSPSAEERTAAYLELRSDPSVLADIEDRIGSYEPGLAHTALTLIEHFLAADLDGKGTVVPLPDHPSALRYRLIERYGRSPRFWDHPLPDLPDNATTAERYAYLIARAARHDDFAAVDWVTRREPASPAEWGHLAPALARGSDGHHALALALQMPGVERRPDVYLRTLRGLARSRPQDVVRFITTFFPQPQRTMHARIVERLYAIELDHPDAWLSRIALHGSVGPALQSEIERTFEAREAGLGKAVRKASRLWTQARFEEPDNARTLAALIDVLDRFVGLEHGIVSDERTRADTASRARTDEDALVLKSVENVGLQPGSLQPGPPQFTFTNPGPTPILIGPGGLAAVTVRWQLSGGGQNTAAVIRLPRDHVPAGREFKVVAPITYPRERAVLRCADGDIIWTPASAPWNGPTVARIGSASLPLVPLEDATLFEVHAAGDTLHLPSVPQGKRRRLRIELTAWTDDRKPVDAVLTGVPAPARLGTLEPGVKRVLQRTIDVGSTTRLGLRIERGPALVEITSIAIE